MNIFYPCCICDNKIFCTNDECNSLNNYREYFAIDEDIQINLECKHKILQEKGLCDQCKRDKICSASSNWKKHHHCIKIEPTESKNEKGKKFDADKLRYDLIDAYALEQIAKIYTIGAKKYGENNWRKGMSWGRLFAATMRHCWAFWKGEELDPDDNIHHMAHAAWNCLTLVNYSKFKIGNDDRWSIINGENKK